MAFEAEMCRCGTIIYYMEYGNWGITFILTSYIFTNAEQIHDDEKQDHGILGGLLIFDYGKREYIKNNCSSEVLYPRSFLLFTFARLLLRFSRKLFGKMLVLDSNQSSINIVVKCFYADNFFSGKFAIRENDPMYLILD